jgi:NAD(P)-dependent dehydrogenase (short-subunit alcohol dehydrogenase family)
VSRFSLEGRTALITGAAGLLGHEHAAALLEAEASVVLTDLREDALDAARDKLAQDFPAQSIRALHMDVTDAASIEQVRDALGPGVDILINNAAVDPKVGSDSLEDTSRLESLPLERWDLELQVGLTGAFLTSRVFGAEMARRGAGVILNIASDLSVIAPDQRLYARPDRAPAQQPVKPVTYSVVKTGLLGLTRYLATYWAEQGVRVNAISPAGVSDGQDPAFVSRLVERIPMRRMASRSEYRGAVQFLCSDASAYMTGQNLVIDGGRSIW